MAGRVAGEIGQPHLVCNTVLALKTLLTAVVCYLHTQLIVFALVAELWASMSPTPMHTCA